MSTRLKLVVAALGVSVVILLGTTLWLAIDRGDVVTVDGVTVLAEPKVGQAFGDCMDEAHPQYHQGRTEELTAVAAAEYCMRELTGSGIPPRLLHGWTHP